MILSNNFYERIAFSLPFCDPDFFYIPWYNKSVSKLTIDIVDCLHLFFYNKRVKWSDVQPLGFRIRNKDCQPFSYYINSIKQVGTNMLPCN